MILNTSLAFQGQCREAFEFYAKALGGTLKALMPYSDAPPGMPADPAHKDWILHAWLEIGDQTLMGADVPPHFYKGPMGGFDVAFHTRDKAEAKRVFDALAEGGEVRMALAETFWSPAFGSLTDRFGTPWMVNTMPATSGQQQSGR